jgi:hypothetical protein
MTKRIDLLKIDPALARDSRSVNGVLVLFAAPYQNGLRIVGWYGGATVHLGGVPYPHDVKGRIQKHFDREGISDATFDRYRLEAKSSDAVLLPEAERKQAIPSGHRGEMGQSNVCYAYKDGRRKTSPWIQGAIDFANGYHGANLLTDSEAEAEAESFRAQERAAGGLQASREVRDVVERYAMDRAKEKLSELGFSHFDDTHEGKCYDYTCKRDGSLFYVEVKGTQGSGASVILTKNEVAHWRNHQRDSIAVIVHDVKLNPEGESFRPSGGTLRVCLPWVLERAALDMLDAFATVDVLKAIQYMWTVSG